MKTLWILYLNVILLVIASSDDSHEDETVTTTYSNSSVTATPPVSGNATVITSDLHCINNYGECLSANDTCSSDRARVSGALCDDSDEDCCIATLDERNKWKDSDKECLAQYGECVLETHECKGSFENFTCGGTKHRKCCVPSTEEMDTWTDEDKVCQKSMGTCKLNFPKESCQGTFQDETCGGPTQRQCCIPDSDVQKKWVVKDEKCHDKWGVCQYKLDDCSGSYEDGLCGGPVQRQCCIPDDKAKKHWDKMDKKCSIKFGHCQHDKDNCTSSYEDGSDALCGGPDYRKCCVPDSETVSGWSAHDESCSAKGGTCQSTVKKCNTDFAEGLCGGPKDRQCCSYPAKESEEEDESEEDATDSEDDKTTEKEPPIKQKHFYENRTLMLGISVSALVVLLITLICLIRKRRCCKGHRSLRGDPKKMPWYKMEYNELEEEDEGVNLTAMEETTPTYA